MMADKLFFIVLQFTVQTVVFCGVAYLIYCCIKLKHALNMLLRKITAMDCDEILAALQADDTGLARGTPMASASPEPAHVVSATPEKLQRMRARLAALACGGQGPRFCCCMQTWHRSFYRCLPHGSLSSWLALNRIHSSVVLCRVLAVSYTTATACT